jgi:hypothetical protein
MRAYAASEMQICIGLRCWVWGCEFAATGVGACFNRCTKPFLHEPYLTYLICTTLSVQNLICTSQTLVERPEDQKHLGIMGRYS